MRFALLLLFCVLAPGCYAWQATTGQLGILWNREPIQERLDDPILLHPTRDAELRRKLALVLDVREFTMSAAIGLDESPSYTSFYDSGEEPIGWNVSAARPDGLYPRTWSFPFVGTVPYVGFFEKELAIELLKELRAAGDDVLLLPIPAYSTLGWFDDPVFTAMLLSDDEARIAEVVIHELAHATVWIEDEVELNENLASFVGEEGARLYFLSKGGPDDPRLATAAQSAKDSAIFNLAMLGLAKELGRIFEASGPQELKLALKSAAIARFRDHYSSVVRAKLSDDRYDWVLEIELNNAILLQFQRYHGEQVLFQALHDRCGRSLPATIRALQQISQADDPRAALRARATSSRAPRPAADLDSE
ncbi:MAG: aminopeptidase [Planctomycetes bacterium]|nr:aminopeptidase [Planctomycetota bacterium]